MKLTALLLLLLVITGSFAITSNKTQKSFLQSRSKAQAKTKIPGIDLRPDMVTYYLHPSRFEELMAQSGYVFDHVDSDYDGHVYYNENLVGISYLIALAGLPPQDADYVQSFFYTFDDDYSNTLQKTEFFYQYHALMMHIHDFQLANPHLYDKYGNVINQVQTSQSFLQNTVRNASGLQNTHKPKIAPPQHTDGEQKHHDGELHIEIEIITSEDLEWLLKKENKQHIKDLSAVVFDLVDFNHNSEIDIKELLIAGGYISGQLQIPPPTVYDVLKAFSKFDVSGDDVLAKKEFTKGIRHFLKFAAKQLREQEEIAKFEAEHSIKEFEFSEFSELSELSE